MRKPHFEPVVDDLSAPLKDMEQGDCFGKEYDLSTYECDLCADNAACSIIYLRTHIKPKGFVDTIDKTDVAKLKKTLIDKVSNVGCKASEAIADFKKILKSDNLADTAFRLWLRENNFIVINDYIEV